MIIQRKDRAFASKTAPAHGLYLHQVNYDEEMR
jgi:tRNA U38,U39,U40 pseudouridine synthase TruA